MKQEKFIRFCNELKAFYKEQKKLDDVLKVVCPSSTGVVELGNDFVGAYVDLMDDALGTGDFFSWFVFDNDFGARKRSIKIDGKEYVVKNEVDFYNIIDKLK